MQTNTKNSPLEDDFYLAGERVAPGIYKQIGGLRELYLDHEDYLPASLDGHVACYKRVQHTWGQMQSGRQGDQKRRADSTRPIREVKV